MGSFTTLTAADGFACPAYVAQPAGAPKGAIVVVQEIFGVNAHIRAVADGYATRTMIEHLGCYLIKHGAGGVRLYGPRSSAKGLVHALETAAHSVW